MAEFFVLIKKKNSVDVNMVWFFIKKNLVTKYRVVDKYYYLREVTVAGMV